MTERLNQASFTAGELSEGVYARVDLTKYSSGVRKARNMLVLAEGGLMNRPGLEFVREVKSSANGARLVPFELDDATSYVLEFGHLYFRVFKNGGVVLSGSDPYEVVTTYGTSHVRALNFAQDNDIMYGVHGSFVPRKISRIADNNWTIGDVSFGPSMAAPTGLSATPIFIRRNGGSNSIDYFIVAVDAGGLESVPTAGTTVQVMTNADKYDGRHVRLSWNASAGAVLYQIRKDNGDEGNRGILAETPETTIDLRFDLVEGDNSALPSGDMGAPATPTGVTAEIVYGQPISYKVSAVNEDTGEESLPSAEVTAVNDLTFASNRNILSWSAVSGASAYIIYKLDNGTWGYIGRSETTTFIDNNITADLADGPQIARNPFTGSNNYPRVVGFIEQRLGFASTIADPQAVFLSQSVNYENFGYSEPAKASDAVTFRVKSRKRQEIRSMLALKGLMLLTAGAEWRISGGSQSDAITPSAIATDNEGYRGASWVQPLTIGNVFLMEQATGCVVRDAGFEITQNGYGGRDLTVLSRHLFMANGAPRSIRAWAYAQSPHEVVWVVFEDGSLASLTYIREHEVWAWTHHKSGPNDEATFEDVVAIPENGEHVVYFIVRRTIGGQTKRYIERMQSRSFATIADAFFVDSGLTYSGSPATIITGLDHLNGQSVVALADGNVVRGLTVGNVTGGVGIVLPNAASKVHVGLPMTSTIETLDLDLGAVRGLGTVQGRKKSVSEVTLRVERTRGIFIGDRDGDRDNDRLVEYKQRATEAWNEAIQEYTGLIEITPHWDWNDHGRMVIKQFDPLPMKIQAIMPGVVVGG